MKYMFLFSIIFGVIVMLNNGEQLKFKNGCYPILQNSITGKILEIRCKNLDGSGGIAYITPFSRVKWVSSYDVDKKTKHE
jgi:hypothetical protein